ncbi:MAG: hypothetical protein PHU63_01060 [Candidatus ainarchaeum sp.]|nr:hypothetical protein [Candidatus ainarchaeum sp.]
MTRRKTLIGSPVVPRGCIRTLLTEGPMVLGRGRSSEVTYPYGAKLPPSADSYRFYLTGRTGQVLEKARELRITPKRFLLDAGLKPLTDAEKAVLIVKVTYDDSEKPVGASIIYSMGEGHAVVSYLYGKHTVSQRNAEGRMATTDLSPTAKSNIRSHVLRLAYLNDRKDVQEFLEQNPEF